jgi:TolB-like protein/Flp pilus assembly protein TadD
MSGIRKTYHFGEFSLNVGERVLQRKNREIFLRPKAFDTLLALIEHHGRLVGKDELFKRVWPDASVSDAVLTHCIAEVRQALQDDPRTPQYVKTVSRSGYKFIGNVGEVTPCHDAVPSEGKPEFSIAVLPFENMSADTENEYLCEGLAEELINGLTRIGTIRVVAHSSSFSFKGRNTDVREIGRQLNVGTILEGSIRKSGDHLRVSAQLINAADGYHIWSEQYDRNMDDVFAIQDEISGKILKRFKTEGILGDRSKLSMKRPTENFEAYQLYLKGRSFWHHRGQGFLQKSMDCYQKAIQLDPQFALAYSGLADVFVSLGLWALAPPTEIFPKASDLIRKALEIDPDLAEAHCSQALVNMFYDWDWASAAEQLQQALALKPGCATFHLFNAHYLVMVEHFMKAIDEILTAQALDPLSPLVNANVGFIFILAGECERAIKELHNALEMDPQNARAHFYLGYACAVSGRHEEAFRAFRKAKAAGGMPWCDESIGWVYALMHEKKKARAVLQASLAKIEKGEYVPWSMIALIYSCLGEDELAYEALTKCVEKRDTLLPWIKNTPGLNHLVKDPRIKDLLIRIGSQQHA